MKRINMVQTSNLLSNMYGLQEYFLNNAQGMHVSISSLGGCIRGIYLPDCHEKLQNIALSFYHKEIYQNNSLYAGAILGPNAGRIQNGRLPIASTIYQLTRNENCIHNLHGGFHNISFQNWNVIATSEESKKSSVTLQITLPDGLDGFPGNRTLQARYTLDDQNVLTLEMSAITDTETYINLSSHVYFNLSGDFSNSGLDQRLQIASDEVIYNKKDHIPSYIRDVSHTPFDYRLPHRLLAQIQNYSKHPQLLSGKGYNHAFVLNQSNSSLTSEIPSAILYDSTNKRRMSLSTDAPCMVLYSGGYMEDHTLLEDGSTVHPSCAIALEAQDYPDAPGNHGFPYHTLRPGEVWTRTIQWAFAF